MSQKWVCQTWKENPEKYERQHVFEENSEDGFCPENPPYHGILVLETLSSANLDVLISFPENNQKFEEGTNITISAITISANTSTVDGRVEFFVDDIKIGEDFPGPHSTTYLTVRGKHTITAKLWDSSGASITSLPVSITVESSKVSSEVSELGLCVIVMDASASMMEPAFSGSPLTRMRLVATTVAAGIFDLERMRNNPYAFVAAFKFDDRHELLFMDNVAKLISRYDGDVTKFASYIYEELFKSQGGTDINGALINAHEFVGKFLKGQLPDFLLQKYRIMVQRILQYGSAESVAIPNVRVLICTDGTQFVGHRRTALLPNPFVQYPLEGLNHDILIGAYLGQEDDEGCKELRSLLSKCPIHNQDQFFLFDNPAKIDNLKYLFRMASGASGFCPKCLEKELYR